MFTSWPLWSLCTILNFDGSKTMFMLVKQSHISHKKQQPYMEVSEATHGPWWIPWIQAFADLVIGSGESAPQLLVVLSCHSEAQQMGQSRAKWMGLDGSLDGNFWPKIPCWISFGAILKKHDIANKEKSWESGSMRFMRVPARFWFKHVQNMVSTCFNRR